MKGDLAFGIVMLVKLGLSSPYLFSSCHFPLFHSLEAEILGGEKQEIQIKGFTRCLA